MMINLNNKGIDPPSLVALIPPLLQWYRENQRALPWRKEFAHQGTGCVKEVNYWCRGKKEPVEIPCDKRLYTVWLSEMMLQQTTVATVIPYFLRFIKAMPHWQALAQATEEEVLWLWQGLGYYSRARNLLQAAKHIAQQNIAQQSDEQCYEQHKPNIISMPQTPAQWELLPGVGPYSARAICAIGFHYPAVALDGNLYRVFSRLGGIGDVEGGNWKERIQQWVYGEIQQLANNLPVDWVLPWGAIVEGLMDLGATVCKVKAPTCDICPLSSQCVALKMGQTLSLPPVKIKPVKPVRLAHCYVVRDELGCVLLRQTQNDKRLLKGLWGFPMSDWVTQPAGWRPHQGEIDLAEPPDFPFPSESIATLHWQWTGWVRHEFTHFCAYVGVWCARIHVMQDISNTNTAVWIKAQDLHQWAFSTLMRKVQTLALKNV